MKLFWKIEIGLASYIGIMSILAFLLRPEAALIKNSSLFWIPFFAVPLAWICMFILPQTNMER